jgi:hypothetical protein
LGNLSTPASVQKLQMALHAKAKAEPGFRFYALYDKIYREDILAHAWAQSRSNKGAPGVDWKEFADIEAYGVERWLGELALALRQETYRPDPIRRVFIRKDNGKMRPLGISTLRDRVCMTAAMLVLDPIFEADLPPEQYAYRQGRNAQQAVKEVGETLFRNHPEVVDADLADYFGSIPHADLMKSLGARPAGQSFLCRPGADQSQSDVRIAHKPTYGGLRRRKIRWIALAASPAYGLSAAEESRRYEALEASARREANRVTGRELKLHTQGEIKKEQGGDLRRHRGQRSLSAARSVPTPVRF